MCLVWWAGDFGASDFECASPFGFAVESVEDGRFGGVDLEAVGVEFGLECGEEVAATLAPEVRVTEEASPSPRWRGAAFRVHL